MSVYNKPPLSIPEQVSLLQSRGLIIHDAENAAHHLSHISYYRLSGYALFFEGSSAGKRDHQFKPNTSFEDILDLYNFDRLLRLLVMDAIERIEVAIRTQVCLNLAVLHKDSHWYTRRELFIPAFKFEKFLKDCKDEFTKSRETFVRHYRQRYSEPELPPSWMIIELLPLGTWSFVYQNLSNRRDKKLISDAFDLSPIELGSWLHSLTYIRNLCAHHGRLWNRHFTITPISKEKYKEFLTPNYTFAAQAAMMHILLSVISPDSLWVSRLETLLKQYPTVDLKKMGFSIDWVNNLFWRK